MAIQVADNFSYQGAKPLDARLKYNTVADMVAVSTSTIYDGILAYVTATKTYYTYDSTNDVDPTLGKWRELTTGGGIVEGYFNEIDDLFYEESTFVTPIAGASKVIYIDLINNWSYRFEDPIFVRLDEEVSNDVMDGYYYNGEFYGNSAHTVQIPHRYNRIYIDVPTNELYRYAGVADGYVHVNEGQITQFDTMPTASVDLVGVVYQYIGTTDANYTKGFFYTCIEDTANPGTYIWVQKNVQPDEDTKIQVAVMPVVTSADEGKIVQYIGVTDATYTNGYFYKCIEGETAGTYEWEAISVQEGGSGGSTFTQNITASIAVGGISVGKEFKVGDSYEDFVIQLIDPIQYPTLTNPSATISGGTTLLETGSSVSRTISATFNRGSINPAYGTTGYRSGAAIDYALNGGTAQSDNSFTETVSESNKTFKIKVNYAAGEQPKDSKGNNYNSPLPAGYVETSTLTYSFVDAMWANTVAIGTIAKLSLVAKSSGQRDHVFPAQTVANPEVFDIPASWTVSAVQVKNDMSGAYEDAFAQFTVTDTTHDDASGTSVAYKRYTFNLGYPTGSRTVRVKFS